MTVHHGAGFAEEIGNRHERARKEWAQAHLSDTKNNHPTTGYPNSQEARHLLQAAKMDLANKRNRSGHRG